MRPGNASDAYRYCVGPGVMQIAHGAPGPIVPRAVSAFGVGLIAARAPGGTGTLILISRANVPSGLNTWIRVLPRSATYTFPSASAAIECGVLNCPWPVTRSPHDFTQSPFLSYFA